MPKNNINISEKILNGLTGQVGVDKEYLISNIHSLRGKLDSSIHCVTLARKLYEILLENGLSESDVINPSRLFDKVIAFIYEKKYQTALEILEVLDGLEFYETVSDKSTHIYYVNNIIESALISRELESGNDVSFVTSLRNLYCITKADIFMQMGRQKESKKIIDEILYFNPVSFDANMFLCKFIPSKQLNKLKRQVDLCYNYAYTKEQIVEVLRCYSYYYSLKSEFLTAYCILRAVEFFDDISLVQADLDDLEREINKKSLERFTVPNKEQVLRILKRENIPFYILDSNFEIVSYNYYNAVIENDNENMKLSEKILSGICGDDIDYVKNIRKLALAQKNGGK